LEYWLTSIEDDEDRNEEGKVLGNAGVVRE
jgi:hypothetical protein